MAAGRPHDKAKATENLREVLGCSTTERSIDAAKRVMAENAALKLKVADLERALRAAWEEDPDEAPNLDAEFFKNATLTKPGEDLIKNA